MEDPVFGTIRHDRELRAWQGESEIRLKKETTLLAIHSNGEPPTTEQQETYRELCKQMPSLRPVIAKAAYRYYRWNRIFIFPFVRLFARLVYGAQDLDAYYKSASRPEQIWELLSHPSIEIPEQQAGSQSVAFLFECDWDEEHGFMVVLTDWRVTYRGLQA